MFEESELLPLSALQHLEYCERQCALIHIEQAWSENRFTAEGRIMHERVHKPGGESRGEVRVEYGIPLRSLKLGISGKADVVEFIKEQGGVAVRAFPVEYKRGKPKKNDCDRVQLCAQAWCLEEMLGRPVQAGALFYGKTKRRLDVSFDPGLREKTREAAKRLHELISSGQTPMAMRSKKCDLCSLAGLCLPGTANKEKSVARYMEEIFRGP